MYDLFLLQFPVRQVCPSNARQHVLDQVEDSHPVADRREEMGAIRAEEQVALAVDGAQQVRELERHVSGRSRVWRLRNYAVP